MKTKKQPEQAETYNSIQKRNIKLINMRRYKIILLNKFDKNKKEKKKNNCNMQGLFVISTRNPFSSLKFCPQKNECRWVNLPESLIAELPAEDFEADRQIGRRRKLGFWECGMAEGDFKGNLNSCPNFTLLELL